MNLTPWYSEALEYQKKNMFNKQDIVVIYTNNKIK